MSKTSKTARRCRKENKAFVMSEKCTKSTTEFDILRSVFKDRFNFMAPDRRETGLRSSTRVMSSSEELETTLKQEFQAEK